MTNREKLKQLTELSQFDKDQFDAMSSMNLWGRREFLGSFGIELVDNIGMGEWAYIEYPKAPQIIIGNQYDDIEVIIKNAKRLVLNREQEMTM